MKQDKNLQVGKARYLEALAYIVKRADEGGMSLVADQRLDVEHNVILDYVNYLETLSPESLKEVCPNCISLEAELEAALSEGGVPRTALSSPVGVDIKGNLERNVDRLIDRYLTGEINSYTFQEQITAEVKKEIGYHKVEEAVADGYVSRTIEGFVVEYGPKLPEVQRDFAECPSDDSLRVFKDWMKAVNYHMLADQRQFPTNIRKCKVLIMETLPKPNAKDLEVKE